MEVRQSILKLNNGVNCELLKQTSDGEMVYELRALKCTRVFQGACTAMLLLSPFSSTQSL